LNISEIEISGNKTIDTEAVKETVQEQISEKYLWLFPKTTYYIILKVILKTNYWMNLKELKV